MISRTERSFKKLISLLLSLILRHATETTISPHSPYVLKMQLPIITIFSTRRQQLLHFFTHQRSPLYVCDIIPTHTTVKLYIDTKFVSVERVKVEIKFNRKSYRYSLLSEPVNQEGLSCVLFDMFQSSRQDDKVYNFGLNLLIHTKLLRGNKLTCEILSCYSHSDKST